MPDLNVDKLELGPANVYFDSRHLGYLGDALEIRTTTTASPLTGAQAGTSPLDEVVTGGTVEVQVPLKEISLENLAAGLPNSELVGDVLTIKNRVGLSLRSIAKELKVVKVVGGVESVDAEDTFTFPEASPSPETVTITFNPTTQREIAIRFRAWPDAETGEWYHVGA